MNAASVELAVAQHFGWRENIIVPNISWGLFGYQEVDLFIVRPSMWGVEVEIKVSASDLKADLAKKHKHWNKLIQRTWFAVPEALANDPNIPDFAGVLSVSIGRHGVLKVSALRAPKINPDARKLTDRELGKVLRLCSMRVWSLKNHLDKRRSYHQAAAAS